MNNIVFSFIITFIAGFSTLLGFLLVFKKKNKNIIISSLAFAAGIMLTVSLIDLLPESFKLLITTNSPFKTILISFVFVLIGMIISSIINKYIKVDNKLFEVGILSMIVIILHNIPEGIITFVTATSDMKLGIILAIAITLHNIPEGISISVPIYYATNSKIKAFLYTFISALSEPFGAFITYLFLKNYVNNVNMGMLFSLIAGIMTYISIFELLPTSFSYKKKIITIVSFMIGVIFMLVTHFCL